MKRNGFSGHRAGPGTSTVLLILVVMCLTMLGVLSMAAARNDLAVTQRSLQAEDAYYQARIQAAQALAEMDEALASGEIQDERITLEVPVDDHRMIRMTAEIFPEGSSDRYALIENRVVIIPEEIEIW